MSLQQSIEQPVLVVRGFFFFGCQGLPLSLELQGNGGEGGIRTLEGVLALTPLAGERFRPLSHLSVEGRILLSENRSVKRFSRPRAYSESVLPSAAFSL